MYRNSEHHTTKSRGLTKFASYFYHRHFVTKEAEYSSNYARMHVVFPILNTSIEAQSTFTDRFRHHFGNPIPTSGKARSEQDNMIFDTHCTFCLCQLFRSFFCSSLLLLFLNVFLLILLFPFCPFGSECSSAHPNWCPLLSVSWTDAVEKCPGGWAVGRAVSPSRAHETFRQLVASYICFPLCPARESSDADTTP